MLSSRKILLAGAMVLSVGYVLLIHSSLAAIYSAVAFLTLGSGLFKPNISTCIGNLFDSIEDPRRRTAFRSFYLWINVAAATAPLVVGFIQSRIGWSVAFGACALSMLVCLCSLIGTRAMAPTPAAKSRPLIRSSSAVGAKALAILCVPGIAFFTVFSQSTGTLIFWARERVDLTLGGWLATSIGPAATCALIPILTVVLLPTVEPLRRLLLRLRLVRSISGELSLSLILAALSILVLAIPELLAHRSVRINASWLLASYVLVTYSELLLVPLSLSLIEAIACWGRSFTTEFLH